MQRAPLHAMRCRHASGFERTAGRLHVAFRARRRQKRTVRFVLASSLLVASSCALCLACSKPQNDAPRPATTTSAPETSASSSPIASESAPIPSASASVETYPVKVPPDAKIELEWFAAASTATDGEKLWIFAPTAERPATLAYLPADKKEFPDKNLTPAAYAKVTQAIEQVKLATHPSLETWHEGLPQPRWFYRVSVDFARADGVRVGYGTGWTDVVETPELAELRKTIEDVGAAAIPALKKTYGPR